jgi:hypothetical protein
MTDSRMIGGEGRASALALSRKFQRKELFELQHGGLRTAKRLAGRGVRAGSFPALSRTLWLKPETFSAILARVSSPLVGAISTPIPAPMHTPTSSAAILTDACSSVCAGSQDEERRYLLMKALPTLSPHTVHTSSRYDKEHSQLSTGP